MCELGYYRTFDVWFETSVFLVLKWPCAVDGAIKPKNELVLNDDVLLNPMNVAVLCLIKSKIRDYRCAKDWLAKVGVAKHRDTVAKVDVAKHRDTVAKVDVAKHRDWLAKVDVAKHRDWLAKVGVAKHRDTVAEVGVAKHRDWLAKVGVAKQGLSG